MGLTTITIAIRLVVGLILCVVVGAQRFTFTPNVKFNYTISPLSPQIKFTPFFNFSAPHGSSMDNSAPTWNTSFSETPWSGYSPGQVGVGTAKSFITGILTTPLQYTFIGTGAWFSGSFDWLNNTLPGPYTYGGVPRPSPRPPDLKKPTVERGLNWLNMTGVNGLPFNEHRGSFSGGDVSQILLELDGLTVETGMLANVSSLDEVQTRVENFVRDDSTLNPFFNFMGSTSNDSDPQDENNIYNTKIWSVSSELDGLEGQARSPWHGQKTAVSNTYLSKIGLKVEPGTTYVIINGTTGPKKGWAEVLLVPEAPGVAIRSAALLNNPWVSVETIFRVPMDPTLQYNLTIRPITDQWGSRTTDMTMDDAFISLHSVQFFSAGDLPKNAPAADGGKSQKSSNTGAIAGGVAGGVAALGILAFVLWFIRKRKRDAGKTKFEIEDSPPEYKNVDEGGYTEQALTGGTQTTPLLGAGAGAGAAAAGTGAAIARETSNHSSYAPQPAVMRALDGGAVPFEAGGVVHALDSDDNLAPVAVRALDSEEVAAPGEAGPGPSTAAMVAMPQYKLDVLLGVLPGSRSDKALNATVRVPQVKVDLLAGASSAPAPAAEKIVPMPQYKLEALLGMPVSNSPEASDTVLSMPQYKLDLLLADNAAAPPGYQA